MVTRPDSRDAPHLFGLGLKEMLADEITRDLRAIRSQAGKEWHATRRTITKSLDSKGINFGTITFLSDGQIDTSQVRGVDPDLRVRPFFAHGGKISIREFVVGAFNDEMGLQSVDPELMQAHNGSRIVTRSGMGSPSGTTKSGPRSLRHGCGNASNAATWSASSASTDAERSRTRRAYPR